MFLLSFIVLYLLWWMLLLWNTDLLMSYADSLLQMLTFPIVATFTGDSSRLLTDALKSPIHLLKVSSFRVYGLCVHCAYVRVHCKVLLAFLSSSKMEFSK